MKKLALSVLLFAGATNAHAATIVSYDIANTPNVGFGGWSHAYNGAITPTVPGFSNYTGGSGTLNDGTAGVDERTTHLFSHPAAPSITLHLDALYEVSSLAFLTNAPGNYIPGNLTSVDVTIGGNTQTVSLAAFGPTLGFYPANELATLNSLLSGTATNTVLLSNFVSDGASGWGSYFAIGEIQVEGALAAGVPEPAAWAMMLAGFGLVGSAMRRREKVAVTFA